VESKLTEEEKQTEGLLCRLSPEVRQALQLALSVVNEQRTDELRGWLMSASPAG
jgi:hypothetical protein